MKTNRNKARLLSALLGSSMLITQVSALPIAAMETPAGTAEENASSSKVLSTADTTVENTGGDHIVSLDALKSAKEFRFSADVELLDYEEGQQSAALLFGGLGANSYNFANFHGKIDWNVPVRAWGYAFDGDKGVEGPAGQDNTWLADHGIDLAQTTHMEVSVVKEGDAYRFTYALNGVEAISTLLNGNYDGGTFALMTYSSAAKFSSIQVEVLDTVSEAQEKLSSLITTAQSIERGRYEEAGLAGVDAALADAQTALENGADDEETAAARSTLLAALDALVLKDGVDPAEFKGAGNGVTRTVGDSVNVQSNGGNYFSVLNSLSEPVNDFVLETDVNFNDGRIFCPAILFGCQSKKTPGMRWYGANMDSSRGGQNDMFRVFGPGFDHAAGTTKGINTAETLHLRLEMHADGSYKFTYGNAWGAQYTMENTVPEWTGGYVGLLAFDSNCTFSRVHFENHTVAQETADVALNGSYVTDLGNQLSAVGGTWTETENGLLARSDAASFALSEVQGADSVYASDISFPDGKGTAGLTVRFSNNTSAKEGYAMYLNGASATAKLVRYQDNAELTLQEEIAVDKADTYHVEMTSIGGRISVTVNGKLVANLGDYTLQYDNRGQSTIAESGNFGLYVRQGSALFQNTTVRTLSESDLPVVTNVDIHTAGDIDTKSQFFTDSPIYHIYLKNNAESAWLSADTDAQTTVTFTDSEGNVVDEVNPADLAEQNNWISAVAEKDGVKQYYKVNAYRLGDDSFYYNEPYRGQYHYSVKEGWLNDPHGIVFYKGKYHMWHQYNTGTAHGPMHWWHVTSTDLIHWENEGLALYPDTQGAMFNGDVVPDETNQSGLFSTDEGGLVALITEDGHGQRLKLATSEDDGKTWKKLDIAVDWTDDPLQSMDFRDPNIFRWEGKWFMVIAGGPLRIYSSDDLVHWQAEAVYGNLHTECPDLYPQEIDGQIKWILDQGGRYYKVGDFKEVDGVWTFVPDAEYENYSAVMNFGKDSYAAITAYISDFGTEENPTIPDLYEVNWMNTWDDYCRLVGDKVGQKFNGTYDLFLKIGLTKDSGSYRMTQTPIDAYQTLRDEENAVHLKNAAVSETENPLAGLKGSSYEVVSRFYPAEGTKEIGFNVRKGNGQVTKVSYNLDTSRISCDRSKSGIQISGKFSEVDSQDLSDYKAVRNADGSIDLHMYVDRSSVEIYAANYEALGAWQIFADPTSLDMEAYALGEACTVDLDYYPMNSIWTDKAQLDEPYYVGTSAKRDEVLYKGDVKTLNAYIMPAESEQNFVWTSSNPEVVSVDENGKVTALKRGNATVTAASAANPDLKVEFTFTVNANEFNTNVEGFNQSGSWYVDGEELIDRNTGANDHYLSQKAYAGDIVYETDVCFSRGLVNLFFASASATDPFAQGGAYALQLTHDENIRLFRFGGEDLASGHVGKRLDDGKYHHVAVERTGNALKVSVDSAEVLNWEAAAAEDFFTNGYVGYGLWDGEARFKNLQITSKSAAQTANKTLLAYAVEYANSAKADPSYAKVHEKVRTAFEAALAQAEEVLADETASQEEVNEAWKNLSQMIQMLGFTSDKSELSALIAQAEAMAEHPEDYEAEGWDAFLAALERAKAVNDDENALDERIEKAVEELSSAMNALQAKAINTELLEMLISVTEKASEADYLPAGWAEFAASLAEAKAILAAPETQSQVDAAVLDLNGKFLALRLKPSEELLKTLKDFVAAAKSIDRSLFSEAQLARIDNGLRIANAALNNAALDNDGAQKAVDSIKPVMEMIQNVKDAADQKQTNEPSRTVSQAANASNKAAASVKTSAATSAGFWTALGAGALAVLLKKRRK